MVLELHQIQLLCLVDKDFDNGVSVFASYTNLDAENAWNGTSSQLSSNLEYNPRVDLMNVNVGKTPWAIENRLVAGLNYTANWFAKMHQLIFLYSIKYILEKDLVMFMTEWMMDMMMEIH